MEQAQDRAQLDNMEVTSRRPMEASHHTKESTGDQVATSTVTKE